MLAWGCGVMFGVELGPSSRPQGSPRGVLGRGFMGMMECCDPAPVLAWGVVAGRIWGGALSRCWPGGCGASGCPGVDSGGFDHFLTWSLPWKRQTSSASTGTIHSGFVSSSNSVADSWAGAAAGGAVGTVRFPIRASRRPSPSVHHAHQAVACGTVASLHGCVEVSAIGP